MKPAPCSACGAPVRAAPYGSADGLCETCRLDGALRAEEEREKVRTIGKRFWVKFWRTKGIQEIEVFYWRDSHWRRRPDGKLARVSAWDIFQTREAAHGAIAERINVKLRQAARLAQQARKNHDEAIAEVAIARAKGYVQEKP